MTYEQSVFLFNSVEEPLRERMIALREKGVVELPANLSEGVYTRPDDF